MPKAIRFHSPGGPEVMLLEDVPSSNPGPGEARVRHAAIGVNFLDVYFRTGLYPVPMPSGLGTEGAGTVEAVGANVTEVAPGNRVAYSGGPLGAYADVRNVPADRLVKLPSNIDFKTAAAVMLKGGTAEYLLRRTFDVKKGHTIVFHAAAGGVGLLACQWAKRLGARVIGTVSTPEKAAVAKQNGCDFPIVTKSEDFVARVKEITGGELADVVYDSIGKDTFLQSLDCLKPRGLLVSFGQSSGPVAPFDPLLLSKKGSLYLTRPTNATYAAKREDLVASAAAVFAEIAAGMKVTIHGEVPLARASDAHRELEGRKTVGSTILIP